MARQHENSRDCKSCKATKSLANFRAWTTTTGKLHHSAACLECEAGLDRASEIADYNRRERARHYSTDACALSIVNVHRRVSDERSSASAPQLGAYPGKQRAA